MGRDRDRERDLDTPNPNDYTPITDFRGMGETLAVIKRDVKDMRPEVREARDGVLRLTEWKNIAEKKLEKLDLKAERAHDCAQVEIISTLQDKMREASVEFATQKAAIADTSQDVSEVKSARSALYTTIIGILITILGSIGGWIWTMATIRADVAHLREQQEQIQSTMRQTVKIHEVPLSFPVSPISSKTIKESPVTDDKMMNLERSDASTGVKNDD